MHYKTKSFIFNFYVGLMHLLNQSCFEKTGSFRQQPLSSTPLNRTYQHRWNKCGMAFCEGPWFTSIREDGCDEGARQLYLGTERNALKTSYSAQTHSISDPACTALAHRLHFQRAAVSYFSTVVIQSRPALRRFQTTMTITACSLKGRDGESKNSAQD